MNKALQALEEVIPPHLRSNRHGESFMGERYEVLKAYIETTAVLLYAAKQVSAENLCMSTPALVSLDTAIAKVENV